MGAFLYKYGPLFARLLVAPIFLYSGLRKFADLGGTAAYTAGAYVMNLGGDPAAAGWGVWRPLVSIAGVVELAGAALLIAGWRTRGAAAGLFAYLTVVTLIFHAFGWAAAADAQAANVQALSLFKNLAILGALLQLLTYGPGRPSVDLRIRVVR